MDSLSSASCPGPEAAVRSQVGAEPRTHVAAVSRALRAAGVVGNILGVPVLKTLGGLGNPTGC